MVKGAWLWLKERPWTVSILLVFIVMALSFYGDEQQDQRERREDAVERVDLAEHDARTTCVAANESREVIRGMIVQISVEQGEALITALGAENDPESAAEVRAYRTQVLTRAEALAATLGERNCNGEAREARAHAARIEGIDP